MVFAEIYRILSEKMLLTSDWNDSILGGLEPARPRFLYPIFNFVVLIFYPAVSV